ncbi:hypothetical protein SDC9_144561 [bioreactor metagenome]|uniref:Uncharacterized protein n=1 Tax=bioreactor metagenome TaxID=1076179 RepID=A0A645E833_9ZZZZ
MERRKRHRTDRAGLRSERRRVPLDLRDAAGERRDHRSAALSVRKPERNGTARAAGDDRIAAAAHGAGIPAGLRHAQTSALQPGIPGLAGGDCDRAVLPERQADRSAPIRGDGYGQTSGARNVAAGNSRRRRQGVRSGCRLGADAGNPSSERERPGILRFPLASRHDCPDRARRSVSRRSGDSVERAGGSLAPHRSRLGRGESLSVQPGQGRRPRQSALRPRLLARGFPATRHRLVQQRRRQALV